MILMISPKNLNVGIIESQVIEKAIELNKYQSVSVLIHESQISKINDYNVTIIPYKNIFSARKYIFRAQIIYCRHFINFLNVYFLRLLFFKSYKIFYSFRALICEESYFSNKNKLKYFILKNIEKFIYKNSDYLGSVSFALKFKLETYFGFRDDIYIQPCCTKNLFLKEKFNCTNIIRFVYVGGLSKWQKFEEILRLYNYIFDQFKHKVSLTIITRDKSLAFSISDKILNSSIKPEIISIPQNKVQSYLKKCDFGFLLRDNHIINNVASPVKLLEYTSSGVIPIMTESIGDYSLEVKNKNIGIIIKLSKYKNLIEQIDNLKDDKSIFKRLYEFSKKYTWKNHFEKNETPLTKF